MSSNEPVKNGYEVIYEIFITSHSDSVSYVSFQTTQADH